MLSLLDPKGKQYPPVVQRRYRPLRFRSISSTIPTGTQKPDGFASESVVAFTSESLVDLRRHSKAQRRETAIECRRHSKAQRRETAIECHILNRMAEFGRLKYYVVVS